MCTETVVIDASTFQHLIARLSETMAQKVLREGQNHISSPNAFHEDIFISIRQAQNTYNFFYWVHSDEQRRSVGWKNTFTVACQPLVRNMMDNLFNITLLLQDPMIRGRQFRASGIRKLLQFVEADRIRYEGRPEWDRWVSESRDKLKTLLHQNKFTEAEVRDATRFPDWPTLGRYLASQPVNDHKKFLKTFTFGSWKQYSAVAHGGPEGLYEVGMFLYRDGHPHEERSRVDDAHVRSMYLHLSRIAILLLAICTEIQAAYKFKDEGARIHERIVEAWKALQQVMEAKEIYDERYEQLMRDSGIM